MEHAENSRSVGDPEIFQKTLDAMLSHIAILSESGEILAVNAAWRRFACGNGLEEEFCGPGTNYLRACEQATSDCTSEAFQVAQGIRDVIAGKVDAFALEYPCHSPTEHRWFNVRITGFQVGGSARVVVSHDDITARKLAEIRVRRANRLLKLQASTDGLTRIANRRIFDRELALSWRRRERSDGALAILLIDVDCFKQFNDGVGHLAGDDCLKAVAGAIRSAVDRFGGLAARYGGEEFAAILFRADDSTAAQAAGEVLEAVRALAIPHPRTRAPRGVVTVSVGVATGSIRSGDSAASLLLRADRALYQAKERGRDRVVAASPLETAPSA